VTDPERHPESQPSQSAVYRRYAQLQWIRGERFQGESADGLAGLLLTCVGFDLEGAELALATTIAGGTFLGIDPSTEHLKAAVRNGACDFMVNTLDESLRVLKNELRKKNALSVGLLGQATAILPAMVERGVQPDLLADTGSSAIDLACDYQSSIQELIGRGAIQVDLHAPTIDPSDESSEVIWTASSIADLRRMDQLALRQLPADDSVRRRWMRQAPAYFHRQRPLQRVLAMRSEEVTRLAEEFKNAISAGEIDPSATFVQHADGDSNEIIAL
jgi:urocanate hydratase